MLTSESLPHAFCILSKDDVEIMLAGYEKPDLYEKREGGVWDVYLRIDQRPNGYTLVFAERV